MKRAGKAVAITGNVRVTVTMALEDRKAVKRDPAADRRVKAEWKDIIDTALRDLVKLHGVTSFDMVIT